MHLWQTKVNDEEEKWLRRAIEIYYSTGQIDAKTPYALLKFLLIQTIEHVKRFERERAQQSAMQQGDQRGATRRNEEMNPYGQGQKRKNQ